MEKQQLIDLFKDKLIHKAGDVIYSINPLAVLEAANGDLEKLKVDDIFDETNTQIYFVEGVYTKKNILIIEYKGEEIIIYENDYYDLSDSKNEEDRSLFDNSTILVEISSLDITKTTIEELFSSKIWDEIKSQNKIDKFAYLKILKQISLQIDNKYEEELRNS